MQILTNYNFKLNLFGPKYDKPKALERFEVKIKRGRKNGKHQKALEREALLNEELVKSITPTKKNKSTKSKSTKRLDTDLPARKTQPARVAKNKKQLILNA